MGNNKKWDRMEIQEMLLNNPKAIERAVVAIYKLQTYNEKQAKDTRLENGVGFNKPDSRVLTLCAEWILKGNNLDGKWLEQAKKKIMKYAGQLTKIANGEIVA